MSRTRFAASASVPYLPLRQLPAVRAAGRLNSGVSAQTRMLRSILISTAGALAFSLLMALFVRTRARETDPSGNPVLRYLAAPYLMLGCAVPFLAVGTYQWFDPFNHRYPGNLVLLSFVPVAIGLFALGMAVYFLSFRAILSKTAIDLYRWPFGRASFKLSELDRMEARGPSTILRFAGNRKFIIYNTYSGRAHFLEQLSANNSFKPEPLRGSA